MANILNCSFVGMLVRALESDWAVLSEEIGLWIPAEVINKEHDDKPEGEEELGNTLSFTPPEKIPVLNFPFGKLKITWHLSARFLKCIRYIFCWVEMYNTIH